MIPRNPRHPTPEEAQALYARLRETGKLYLVSDRCGETILLLADGAPLPPDLTFRGQPVAPFRESEIPGLRGLTSVQLRTRVQERMAEFRCTLCDGSQGTGVFSQEGNEEPCPGCAPRSASRLSPEVQAAVDNLLSAPPELLEVAVDSLPPEDRQRLGEWLGQAEEAVAEAAELIPPPPDFEEDAPAPTRAEVFTPPAPPTLPGPEPVTHSLSGRSSGPLLQGDALVMEVLELYHGTIYEGDA